jgi:hypothetical protein
MDRSTIKNTRDLGDLEKFEYTVNAMLMSRQAMFQQFADPRRDIDDECGYPRTTAIDAWFFRHLYDREPVANRVVSLMPKECFKVLPTIYEDEDAKSSTEFEEAWDDLGKDLEGQSWHADEHNTTIWEYLKRADELSGIGTFGIILLGLDDGKLFQEPAEGVPPDGAPKDMTGVSGLGSTKSSSGMDIYGGTTATFQNPLSSVMGTDSQYFQTQFAGMNPNGKPKQGGQRKLVFLRAFDESLVQVVQYEADRFNPRFGMPVMYLVTLNDPRQPHTGVGLPLASVRVHWSRVIHIADNRVNSEIFGNPRMRPVLNPILDIRKVRGADAEGWWKNCIMRVFLETHPQLGGDVDVDYPALKDMMENMENGLQRWAAMVGMSAKTVAPAVADPTAHCAVQLESICIQLRCPVRVFKGSERGELASSQDDAQWNDQVRERQSGHVTPRIIKPFVDRLIMLGVLPEPEEWHVEWPDLESIGDVEKSVIALQETQALAAYQQGSLQSLIGPVDYFTKVLNWEDEEAQQVTDDAEQEQQKQEQQDAALAAQHGMIPQIDGFEQKQQPPVVMPGGGAGKGMPGKGGPPGAGQPPSAKATVPPMQPPKPSASAAAKPPKPLGNVALNLNSLLDALDDWNDDTPLDVEPRDVLGNALSEEALYAKYSEMLEESL